MAKSLGEAGASIDELPEAEELEGQGAKLQRIDKMRVGFQGVVEVGNGRGSVSAPYQPGHSVVGHRATRVSLQD